MELVFLPDISFYKFNKSSRELKKFQKFLIKLNKLFPKSNFVTNLECVLLKKSLLSNSKKYKKLHAKSYFANFLREHNIKNICLANNHSFDFGLNGLIQTKKQLIENKIKYFGAGKNLKEAKKPLIIKSKDKKLAIFGMSYKPESTNKTSGVFSLKKKETFDIIKKFREENKKHFIVIYCHSGLELFEFPLVRDRLIYKKLIDAGCDIVIGSHPHRFQGIEKYKKKFIFYSIGDLFFNNTSRYDWKNYLTPPAHASLYKEKLNQNLLFKSLIIKVDIIYKKISVYKVKRSPNFNYSINKISNTELKKKILNFKKKMTNKKILKSNALIEQKIFHGSNLQ